MTQILSKSPAYIGARTKLGDHRKVFDSITNAIATLRTIFAAENFPQDFPVVAARVGLVDVTGEDSIPPLAEWPEEYQADGVMICVTFIGVRGLKGEDGKEANGARGFAIYPLHPLDAIRSDESGDVWLWKVAEKEASHVALRGLRNVPSALGTDALAQAAMEMPITVSDYVEESTREGLDTSAFDAIWKQFRTMLAQSASTAALVAQLPGKGEVLKAIRSKAFALEQYEQLEKMGAFTFIADTMAQIIDSMRETAVAQGEDFEMDSSEIKGWLATRDTKVFVAPKKIVGDLSSVDFGAFMAGLTPAKTEEGAKGE
jgi:hypothetical protein